MRNIISRENWLYLRITSDGSKTPNRRNNNVPKKIFQVVHLIGDSLKAWGHIFMSSLCSYNVHLFYTYWSKWVLYFSDDLNKLKPITNDDWVYCSKRVNGFSKILNKIFFFFSGHVVCRWTPEACINYFTWW